MRRHEMAPANANLTITLTFTGPHERILRKAVPPNPHPPPPAYTAEGQRLLSVNIRGIIQFRYQGQVISLVEKRPKNYGSHLGVLIFNPVPVVKQRKGVGW